MKNSTILVFGTLALGGVGAYVYLKGKKVAVVNDVPSATPPPSGTQVLQNLGINVAPNSSTTTPYVKPIEGVPLISEENIQKALLALNIDTTRSITELASPNYIEAKKLASDIKYLSSYKLKNTPPNWKYTQQYTYSEIQMLSRYYGSTIPSSRYMCAGAKGGGVDDCTYKSAISKEDVIKSMTKKLNALGYKLLPNFDIEKM